MLLLNAVLLVVTAAAADAVEARAPAEAYFDAFPASGTTLPENGRLLVSAATRVLISHEDGRVQDLEVGEPYVSVLYGASYGTVTPTLTAGEVITLEPVCDGCSQEPLSWVVGPADTDAPVFTGETSAVEAYGFGDGSTPFSPLAGFEVSLALPALEPGEPVVVHVVGEGVSQAQLVYGVEATSWISFIVDGGAEREACFTVTATDVAGNESAPHPFCVELTDDELRLPGCAQTTASSTAVFALTALLLRRRRR